MMMRERFRMNRPISIVSNNRVVEPAPVEEIAEEVKEEIPVPQSEQEEPVPERRKKHRRNKNRSRNEEEDEQK